MVKKHCRFFLGLLFLGYSLIPLNFCFGASNDVIINEIAWMGTTESPNDEWIELYNKTGEEIDLTGWILKALDGTPEIALQGTIAGHGFFLLERTNDETVPHILSDQIYTGALNNSGENLELRNAENILIDSIDCSNGWLAGDNLTKQTMERTETNWQTGLNPNGTPRAQNSSGAESPPESDEPQDKPPIQPDEPPAEPTGYYDLTNHPPVARAGSDKTGLVSQEIFFSAKGTTDPDNDQLSFLWNFGDGTVSDQKEISHTYSFPGQYLVGLLVKDNQFADLDIIKVNIYSPSIIISEFMPNPEGADAENEWIELFNQSKQMANLTGWQIDDQENGSDAFVFPDNSLIGPGQFLVLTRPITKIALNNDQDQVRLFYPDGSLASQVEYSGKNEQNWSVAFDSHDYVWTETPTPGSSNLISQSDNQDVPQPIVQKVQNFLGSVFPQDLKKDAPQEISQEIPQETSISPTSTQFLQTEPDEPRASLIEITRQNPKTKTILIISIIICSSLLISWLVIRIKKT